MRIQVMISDEMVKRLDRYALEMGVSRSSLCATMIGQGVMGYDKAYQLVNDNLDRLVNVSGGKNNVPST